MTGTPGATSRASARNGRTSCRLIELTVNSSAFRPPYSHKCRNTVSSDEPLRRWLVAGSPSALTQVKSAGPAIGNVPFV